MRLRRIGAVVGSRADSCFEKSSRSVFPRAYQESGIASLPAFAALLLLFCVAPVFAAGQLQEFLPKAQPAEMLPGADRLGPLQAEPPLAAAFAGDQLLGYVYLNSDFANAVGYSGKPVQMLVGIDLKGKVTGIKLVDHKEPIVLVGIPEKRIIESMNKLIGTRFHRSSEVFFGTHLACQLAGGRDCELRPSR